MPENYQPTHIVPMGSHGSTVLSTPIPASQQTCASTTSSSILPGTILPSILSKN